MAFIPSTLTGKIDTSDPTGYPQGKARDVTVPGDGTGTPWVANVVNDIFGLQQALLNIAGVTPNGTPDAADASQYLEAMQKLTGRQVFTANGTFNTPAWVKRIKVTAISGGGGGSGSNASVTGGGGGGGAGSTVVFAITDPAAAYDVVVGAGGAGGAAGSNAGSAGTASSFAPSAGAAVVTGAPGGGGDTATNGGLGGAGGGAATATIPVLNDIYGDHGGMRQESSAVTDSGGDGASSTLGSGGRGAQADGSDAVSYGSGGGGAGGTGGAGGDGADGVVIVEWGIGI